MYATGQTRSSLSMVEEVLNGVNSTEMEKLESDVEEIFNCTINSSSIKMDNPSRIIDPPGESPLQIYLNRSDQARLNGQKGKWTVCESARPKSINGRLEMPKLNGVFS